jgi:hypothetical protein
MRSKTTSLQPNAPRPILTVNNGKRETANTKIKNTDQSRLSKENNQIVHHLFPISKEPARSTLLPGLTSAKFFLN